MNEQLKRIPGKLPILVLPNVEGQTGTLLDFTTSDFSDFQLQNYNPQPAIKAELSTGLIK